MRELAQVDALDGVDLILRGLAVLLRLSLPRSTCEFLRLGQKRCLLIQFSSATTPTISQSTTTTVRNKYVPINQSYQVRIVQGS
jgi:hypothetical protein